MGYLLRIAFLVILILGGIYYYFKDTPLIQRLLPDSEIIKAEESIEDAVLRRILNIEKKGGYVSAPNVVEGFEQAAKLRFNSNLEIGEKQVTAQSYFEGEFKQVQFRIFPTFDLDQDGFWSKEEAPDSILSAYVFSRVDLNNDGKLSLSEVWESFFEEETRKNFINVDKNKDNLLSAEEYFSSVEARRNIFLSEIDTDFNNDITFLEINAYQIKVKLKSEALF